MCRLIYSHRLILNDEINVRINSHLQMTKKQKKELTWIGKENRPKLEPRTLLENSLMNYHAKTRRREMKSKKPLKAMPAIAILLVALPFAPSRLRVKTKSVT